MKLPRKVYQSRLQHLIGLIICTPLAYLFVIGFFDPDNIISFELIFIGGTILMSLHYLHRFIRPKLIIGVYENGIKIPQYNSIIPWHHISSIRPCQLSVASRKVHDTASTVDVKANAIKITFDNSIEITVPSSRSMDMKFTKNSYSFYPPIETSDFINEMNSLLENRKT